FPTPDIGGGVCDLSRRFSFSSNRRQELRLPSKRALPNGLGHSFSLVLSIWRSGRSLVPSTFNASSRCAPHQSSGQSAKCADRVLGTRDKSAATSDANRYSHPHRARRHSRSLRTRRVASQRICVRSTQVVETVRSQYRYLSARIYSRVGRPRILHYVLAPASPQATGYTG